MRPAGRELTLPVCASQDFEAFFSRDYLLKKKSFMRRPSRPILRCLDRGVPLAMV